MHLDLSQPSESPGRVGAVARGLGFAGLLPPLALVALIAWTRASPDRSSLLATALDLYAAIILSFLGGMWWSFAMRRRRGQGGLAALAVAPSLVTAALLLWSAVSGPNWPGVALGSAVLLTLLVDRHLVATGEAPAGWMGLRMPLSLGLGLLTIAAGALAG
ncbi:DUF3429 domain-containing protein [Sphingomonas bacterium]|uniref:DUF3429 domain-containing protein n=1 Tax=Sphingomonas bacterium TaxID=1895847 RepID=UPI0015769859|nr:DUF3429 domain-containing protein [Sphingomonas bacterium]